LVFWNAENAAYYGSVSEILPKYAPPKRIFAITDKPLHRYPYLFKYPIYGHHLIRRFNDAAIRLYSKLCETVVSDV
jgi:hypothetical protein